jgi:hypothetical protein
MASWSQWHVSSCCDWIISQNSSEVLPITLYEWSISRLNFSPNFPVETLSEVSMSRPKPSWFTLKLPVASVMMALECARQESWRDWPVALLALHIAAKGKTQEYLTIVCMRSSSDVGLRNEGRSCLSVILPPPHLGHPYKMNLGNGRNSEIC